MLTQDQEEALEKLAILRYPSNLVHRNEAAVRVLQQQAYIEGAKMRQESIEELENRAIVYDECISKLEKLLNGISK